LSTGPAGRSAAAIAIAVIARPRRSDHQESARRRLAPSRATHQPVAPWPLRDRHDVIIAEAEALDPDRPLAFREQVANATLSARNRGCVRAAG
jgi:hypothetical protein